MIPFNIVALPILPAVGSTQLALDAAPLANIGSRSSPTSPKALAATRTRVDCFSAEKFIKHVFMDSDTELAVLSFVPELPENDPLSLEEANRVRVLVDRMEGAHRLFLHAMVVPNAGPEVARSNS